MAKINMRPNMMTDNNCLAVLEELKKLEPIFHHPEPGMTRKDFEMMTAESFYEVGASGRIYSREYVLDVLEERLKNPQEDKWETENFHCLEIAKRNYLLTYKLIQGKRITRRSTIWRKDNGNWKIVYHQGTIVENT
jgi:hypothetical protein